MALKFKFKSKDEVPAEHLSLYTERDGAWLLDVEGAVEKTKLDEFRTSNVALLKERDELKQRKRPAEHLIDRRSSEDS